MPLQLKPPGLLLHVDEGLRGVLALGQLEAEGASLAPLPNEFDDECARLTTRLETLYAGKQPADIPGVAETRALFHRLDIDPTKTRPSSEALLRRVLQGKGLPRVNAIVDVCNLSSLEHQLPLGLYDRDQVRGPVRVRVGAEHEGYAGIRKAWVNLAGRLLLTDDDGPFGAPTSDSRRTSVTNSTGNVLIVIFTPPERGSILSTSLEQLAGLLSRYCGARVVGVRMIQ